MTINERLKFLIDSLNLSVRGFSNALEIPDSNTRNYLTKGTKLNSDYLERISRHFKHVDINWLITGNGEPFLAGVAETSAVYQTQKKNMGNLVGVNHGTATQRQGPVADSNCQQQLAAAQELVQQLKSQLLDKERLIQLLEKNSK